MSESKLYTQSMEFLDNIHPGEILLEEFLRPMGVSQYRLAQETFMPESRITNIIKGKTSITADTAVRLGAFFGMEAQFWINLQTMYDIEEVKRSNSSISQIKKYEVNIT